LHRIWGLGLILSKVLTVSPSKLQSLGVKDQKTTAKLIIVGKPAAWVVMNILSCHEKT
jgi:hypothetical protein